MIRAKNYELCLNLSKLWLEYYQLLFSGHGVEI